MGIYRHASGDTSSSPTETILRDLPAPRPRCRSAAADASCSRDNTVRSLTTCLRDLTIALALLSGVYTPDTCGVQVGNCLSDASTSLVVVRLRCCARLWRTRRRRMIERGLVLVLGWQCSRPRERERKSARNKWDTTKNADNTTTATTTTTTTTTALTTTTTHSSPKPPPPPPPPPPPQLTTNKAKPFDRTPHLMQRMCSLLDPRVRFGLDGPVGAQHNLGQVQERAEFLLIRFPRERQTLGDLDVLRTRFGVVHLLQDRRPELGENNGVERLLDVVE
eukprot:450170-Rhodomonas_salina.1